MRPHPVVVPPPALNHNLCFPQRVEHLAIEQFVTQPRVETLDIAVLPRTARRDVDRPGAQHGNPSLHSLGDELRTVIGADIPRRTAQDEQLRQQLDNIDGLEAARHPDGEAFARELIDRVEHPVLAPVMSAILDEVVAPDVVYMLGPQAHTRALGNAAALRKVHVDLAELGNDLFGLVSLLWHDGPPVCSSHNIRMDHFKGGGSGVSQRAGS